MVIHNWARVLGMLCDPHLQLKVAMLGTALSVGTIVSSLIITTSADLNGIRISNLYLAIAQPHWSLVYQLDLLCRCNCCSEVHHHTFVCFRVYSNLKGHVALLLLGICLLWCYFLTLRLAKREFKAYDVGRVWVVQTGRRYSKMSCLVDELGDAICLSEWQYYYLSRGWWDLLRWLPYCCLF